MSNNPTEDTEKPDLANIDFHSHWARDVLRYADTDRQGHVNNAVFATFLESGRVAILYNPERPLAPKGASFVIARLVLDFRTEIHWPNEVAIGTTVTRLGNSSVTFGQGIFVNGICAAVAETIIVLMDETTRKSRPLPIETRNELTKWLGRKE
jgi:acyl-CoA thioester hydrolase